MLENYIRNQLTHKDILLMTHLVLGFPSFEENVRIVGRMVEAGVDLIELQIPFSEPFADGPVILGANQRSLAQGTKVAQCMACARELAARFPVPLLFMSYLNIPFVYGMERFMADAAAAGLRGTILPDAPLEEEKSVGYLKATAAHGLDPVLLFAPTSSDERMAEIARHAKGFVYCVARKGVTGQKTDFNQDLDAYLARCREATNLPLALGFGIASRADVARITGKVEIAVVGSQLIRVHEQSGADGVGEFLRSLAA